MHHGPSAGRCRRVLSALNCCGTEQIAFLSCAETIDRENATLKRPPLRAAAVAQSSPRKVDAAALVNAFELSLAACTDSIYIVNVYTFLKDHRARLANFLMRG
jgi:hypothetical protein